MEEQLRQGRMDCATMSRQLIADSTWVQKVKEEKVSKIQRCVRCNKKCLNGLQHHHGIHCIYE